MFKAVDKWLPAYLGAVLSRPGLPSGQKHLMFCMADHYEPFRDGAAHAEARTSVGKWTSAYPVLFGKYKDADGCSPRHTFFYPQEEYDSECLKGLAGLCRQTCSEVEIQIHHRNDTPDGFRKKLKEFCDILHGQHALLGCDRAGRVRYGFVHGNWALCNSRPDGDWCGVNEELGILAETGCYADFTFPSAPSPTQPRMVNAIYRAQDTPGRPGGCEKGVEVGVRGQPPSLGSYGEPRGSGFRGIVKLPIADSQEGKSLMLITGPLALDWGRRKCGVLPRLENGAITGRNQPLPFRIDCWVRQHIHVRGKPAWIFVKVYTHGCFSENSGVVLGEPMQKAHEYLCRKYNDRKDWSLHYVTAREMYNIVRAAEDGKTGNPGEFRNYEIISPER